LSGNLNYIELSLLCFFLYPGVVDLNIVSASLYLSTTLGLVSHPSLYNYEEKRAFVCKNSLIGFSNSTKRVKTFVFDDYLTMQKKLKSFGNSLSFNSSTKVLNCRWVLH
jgi:hypothetical protein